MGFICTKETTMNIFAVALSGAGRGMWEEIVR
jgi:hypothetical protein